MHFDTAGAVHLASKPSAASYSATFQACAFSPVTGRHCVVVYQRSGRYTAQVYDSRLHVWLPELDLGQGPQQPGASSVLLSVSADEAHAAVLCPRRAAYPALQRTALFVLSLPKAERVAYALLEPRPWLGIHWMQGRTLALVSPGSVSLSDCGPPASSRSVYVAQAQVASQNSAGTLLAVVAQSSQAALADIGGSFTCFVTTLTRDGRCVWSSKRVQCTILHGLRPPFRVIDAALGDSALALVSVDQRGCPCVSVVALSGQQAGTELFSKPGLTSPAWRGPHLAAVVCDVVYIFDGHSGLKLADWNMITCCPIQEDAFVTSVRWAAGSRGVLQVKGHVVLGSKDELRLSWSCLDLG